MKLFDSHCHLDDKIYDKDLKDVLSRGADNGVSEMMIVGVDNKSSQKAVTLAESKPELYASIGFHPHDAKECSKQALDFLINLAESPKVKAWGEIGLDFNRMYSPKQDQERWLIRQLEISDQLGLPVIFHERESGGRLLKILKKHFKPHRNGVIHCFSGNETELSQYLALGLYIGITGIITIKGRGTKLRHLAPLIPADRILIETDAPYLTPAPEKNKTRRNEPSFVKSVLLKLAEVRGEKPDELAEVVYENTRRLYNI